MFFILFAAAIASSLREDFSSFEAKYGKNYVPAERAFRAKIFDYNMKWIEKTNAEGHSYTVGVTPFADMTNTEFASMYASSSLLKPVMIKPANPVLDIAFETVDWREKGAVSPVKNPGPSAECWALSAMDAMESGNFIANGKMVLVSEQQLLDCVSHTSESRGGMVTSAFDYVKQKGICSSSDYPYSGKHETCKDSSCTPAFHITGYEKVTPDDGKALKAAVYKTPVVVHIDASSRIFQMYKSGVIDSPDCGTQLNHAVVAVGYTDEYWILKNSWGSMWGEKGYLRIAYSETGSGICGINLYELYPTF